MNTAGHTAGHTAADTTDPPPSHDMAYDADRGHSDRRFAALVTGLFAVVVGLLIWRHAPWRDELQAWAIVRDNPNPLDLLARLRYEGHPALWYAILWLPARITRSVAALQLVQWVLAVGAAAIVATRAPFSRPARVLLLTSYFPLFEYGVIARSYTLVWFITVGMLALLPRRSGLIALAGGTLLLTNTTVLAIPLALSLAVGVLADRTVQPQRTTRFTRLTVGLAPVLGILVALFSARPASDARHAGITLRDANDRLAIDLAAPLRALVPIPRVTEHFWDTHVLDLLPMIAAALAVFIVAGFAWMVRRHRAALIVWLGTATTVPLILYSRDLFASPRFCGVIFVAAVASLWLANHAPAPSRLAVTAPLALGMIGTLGSAIALVLTWSTPFTGARATADWLRANGYADAPIVCSTNFQCSSVGIRLDRPTESVDQTGLFTYAVFRTGTPIVDARSPVTTARARANEENTPVIVLTPQRPSDIRVDVVARFDRSVVGDETYWVSVVLPEP